MLRTNCHALHFTLPSDAKIQKNAVLNLKDCMRCRTYISLSVVIVTTTAQESRDY